MEEEAESSSASALVLVALVMVLAVALLVRGRWLRAAAWREEVRCLTRLAAEESELAERGSVLAYYSELFPAVVHAAKVPVAPEWGPPPVVAAAVAAAPGPAQEEFDAQPSVGAKGSSGTALRHRWSSRSASRRSRCSNFRLQSPSEQH